MRKSVQLMKSERIEIRISDNQKQMLLDAIELTGDNTITSFITRLIKKECDNLLKEKEKILLTKRDREVFFDALYNANIQPNKNLTAAFKLYEERRKGLHTFRKKS